MASISILSFKLGVWLGGITFCYKAKEVIDLYDTLSLFSGWLDFHLLRFVTYFISNSELRVRRLRWHLPNLQLLRTAASQNRTRALLVLMFSGCIPHEIPDDSTGRKSSRVMCHQIYLLEEDVTSDCGRG